MPRVTGEATILQAFSYSETSKILRLLTPTHGVQSVIARGALRPKSRYGGILEPFTDGVADFYIKENRDLQTLAGFDLVRPRQGLGRDLVRFGAASLLAEIVLRTASEQAMPELYARVRLGLTALETAPVDRLEEVALTEIWALIVTLGFGPALDQCVSCGGPTPPDRERYFDYAAGGVYCGDCGGGSGGGRVLPPDAIQDLLTMLHGETPSLDRTRAHWQLLERFLAYHLVDAGALRSLQFLADTVQQT